MPHAIANLMGHSTPSKLGQSNVFRVVVVVFLVVVVVVTRLSSSFALNSPLATEEGRPFSNASTKDGGGGGGGGGGGTGGGGGAPQEFALKLGPTNG